MKKFGAYLMGFIKIKISGEDKSKFLNLAVKKGFRFAGFKREKEFYILKVKVHDFKRLAKLRREYKLTKSVKISIIKKVGLPILVNYAKKRLGLVLGATVGITLYMFLYSHYWVINTPSEEGVYTQEIIIETAKNAGVFVGAKRNEVDEKIVANRMLFALSELSWISLNTKGCNVDIVLKYKTSAAQPLDTQGVQNIIAKKTGIIKAIEAKNGMVEVEVGEAVQEGDLLITGIWDTNRGANEWEKKEEVDIFYEKARGKVMAETTANFEVSISEFETIYIEEKSYKRFSLGIFGFDIPITFNLVPNGDYNYTQKQKDLWLLNTKLPLFFKTETLNKLYSYEKTITESEAKARLNKLLDLEIEKAMGEDGEVLKRFDVVYEYSNNVYTAKLQCICIENISKEQEVVIK